MMRLQFDRTEGAAVYDATGITTDWRRVGGAHPMPRLGLRHAAQYFDGTVGYEGRDEQSVLMGLRALHIRALVRPDFEALAGKIVTLLARGQGGPTVPEGWAYDLRLAVTSDARSAVVQLAWTDETVTEVIHDLGTVARPSPESWTLLAVNREVVGGIVRMRLAVNGEPFAEVTTADQVPATPGVAITMGRRRTGSEHGRSFIGDIEFVQMDDVITSTEAEHWFAAVVLHLPDESLDTVREYWFDAPSVLRIRDSIYETYRMRPLAAAMAESLAAIELRERAWLPTNAHGERLASWERALALTEGAELNLAERQSRAANALALVEGISADAMHTYAAQVLDLESLNGIEAVTTAVGIAPDGLWLGEMIDRTGHGSLTAEGNARLTTGEGSVFRHSLYSFDGTDGQAFAVADNSIGDIDESVSFLSYVLFRVREVPPTGSHFIYGKQDFGGTRTGYVLRLRDGLIQLLVDPAGAAVLLDLPIPPPTNEWIGVAWRVDRTSNTVSLASSQNHSVSSALNGTLANVGVLRIGDARSDATPPITGDVALIGFTESKAVETLDLTQIAQSLLDDDPSSVLLVEDSNDYRPNLSQTATETIHGITREHHRAWRTYGNIATNFDASSDELQMFAADPDASAAYSVPLPASNIKGAGFAEFSIEQNTRISFVARNPFDSATANPMLRCGNIVQYFSIATSELIAIRYAGNDTSTTEPLADASTMPQSPSNTWRVALRVIETGDTEIKLRAIEHDDDPDAFVTFVTASSSLGGPAEWAGFHTAQPFSNPLFVSDLRIQHPTRPARDWRVITNASRNPNRIAAMLARKNRATARAGYSRDRFARAGSAYTFVGYTPIIGETL